MSREFGSSRDGFYTTEKRVDVSQVRLFCNLCSEHDEDGHYVPQEMRYEATYTGIKSIHVHICPQGHRKEMSNKYPYQIYTEIG